MAPLDEAYVHEIERASRALILVLVRASGETPAVTGAQLAALSAIARLGEVSMTQLAGELGTIPSWVSRICDRLEAEGYIDRRPSPVGRRQVSITLRAEGAEVLSTVQQRRRAALVPLLEQMKAEERSALLDGLRGFVEVAGVADDVNLTRSSFPPGRLVAGPPAQGT